MKRLDTQNNKFLGQLTQFRQDRKSDTREKQQLIAKFSKSTSKTSL